MISVVIIGYGNVAQHLHNAFIKADGVKVKQIYSRSLSKIKHLKKVSTIDNIKNLEKADIYIITISDNAISKVSSLIKNKTLVVHTSGSIAKDALLNPGNKGVFYPLQSFSKDKEIDFYKIPFCLEAENDNDYNLLKKLALSIGQKIYEVDSKQRQKLHVAAVFVNNFTNHMYKIGYDICNDYSIPFEILYPLIKETSSKIEMLTPKEAQTGPANRNDSKTIKNHLSILNEEQQEIYKTLTKSIQNG